MKRLLFAVLLAAVVSPAFGALDGYMTITGQGWNGPQKIHLVDFKNQAVTSTEFSSGRMVVGHRKWSPFVITRQLDKASPKLAEFCANGKHINFSIEVYAGGAANRSKPTYVIHFIGASLSKPPMSSGGDRPIESLSFSFQKIEWTWTEGGKTFQDDWEARQ